MSSFDVGPVTTAEFFVPDVEGSGTERFEPEVVRAGRDEPEDTELPEPVDLEDYHPGPSEDEIRATCRAEMKAELEAELERQRSGDREAFGTLAEEIRRASESRLDAMAERAAELAFAVAERLIRDRVDRDPTVVERALREVIGGIEGSNGLTVHVHPEDAAYLRSQSETLDELGIEQVVDDPRQRRGGCRVDDGSRGWDLAVVTQLTRLQETIDTALESS